MMNIRIDRALIGATGGSRRHLLVDVTAPESPAREGRVPVNVALVLDRSGSMAGAKLSLARAAAVRAVRMLGPKDRISVVIYDEVVEVLAASTHATPEARASAVRLLEGVQARGCTDLATGWLRGCEQVAAHLRDEAVGKVLLLSDGLANRGITVSEELARHARELRARGVLTSTFGVGADFDERLMQTLAAEGAGHFYFIERPEQIPDLLTSELGETLEVVARDVEIFVGVPEGAAAEVLHDFPSEPENRGLRCRLGNLVSGQQVSVLFAVIFPTGGKGAAAAIDVTLTDRQGVFDATSRSVALRFAGSRENAAQPRNTDVDRTVAEVYAGRARRKALEVNRAGDYEQARQTLIKAAARIRRYAGDDPGMRDLCARLEHEASEFGRRMDALAMKRHHFDSHKTLMSRDVDGKSRRSPRAAGPA
jgi:Ca-activated chloride channel family protein